MQKASFALPRETLLRPHKSSTTGNNIHTNEKTETYPELSSPKSS